MDKHGRYFQERFEAGEILLFGPVLATSGAFRRRGARSEYGGRGATVGRSRPYGEIGSKHIRDTPHACIRRSR